MRDTDPPARMDSAEKTRLRAAAYRAQKLYPGPVGDLLSMEILTWEEFGYRFGGNGSLMPKVIDFIMKAKMLSPSPSSPKATVGAVGYE